MPKVRRNAWMLAAASGVLQVLIFPDPSIYILSWVALAPLIYAILQCRNQDALLTMVEDGKWFAPATTWQGFWLGYLGGVIWYLGSCYWVFHVMHVYGNLGSLTSFLLLLAYSFYLALYHGLFGALLALIARRRNGYSLRALVFAPFAWVAVELARSYITGFPWDLLGTTQIDNIPLSRIATVTGVYGLSFEIALVNTAVAAAFLVPRARRNVMLAASLAAALILHSGKLVKPPALSGTLGVTLVQSNIAILDDPWSLDYLQQTLGELRALSVRPAQSPPGTTGLIIWPESPAPFFVTDLHLRGTLGEVARSTDSYILAGSIGIEHAGDPSRQPEIFNSASLVAPDGAWIERYDKIHLVPFGEYIPFQNLLFFAQKLTREIGTFARGTRRVPLNAAGVRLGTFICYESVFPNEVRQFALHGATVFVNISNDGWYGPTGAPGQHLNMARMRAVENDRWLLRDTNSGITAVIDPFGRIIAQASRNQRTALQGAYSLIEDTTFYTRHGDWFPFLCAIITLAGVALRFREPAENLQPAPV